MSDDGQKVTEGSTRDSLLRQVKDWATPMVPNGGRAPGPGMSSTGMMPDGSKRQVDLGHQARNWPTPDASVVNDGETLESWEARNQREREKGQNGNGMGTPLAIAALQWPTSRAAQGGQDIARRERLESGGDDLETAAQLWSTPMARDAGKRSGGKRKGDDLSAQTEMWPAPAARDYRAPNAESYQDRAGTSKGEQLPNFVEHRFRPSATTATDGERSSSTARTSPRRLNPAFVEWLMGWPGGWAQIETTSSGCSETEWSRWEQLMASCLCSLKWLRTEP